MIAFSAADLIWATRIKGTADALGLTCQPVRSAETLRNQLDEGDLRALIVDLEEPELALELIGMVRERRQEHESERPIRVLAFGPHVAGELLGRALDAGADDALPRGAFARSLPDILLRLTVSGAQEPP